MFHELSLQGWDEKRADLNTQSASTGIRKLTLKLWVKEVITSPRPCPPSLTHREEADIVGAQLWGRLAPPKQDSAPWRRPLS